MVKDYYNIIAAVNYFSTGITSVAVSNLKNFIYS